MCLLGLGPRRGADGKFAAPCKHMTGCTDFQLFFARVVISFMFNNAMGACSESMRVSMFD